MSAAMSYDALYNCAIQPCDSLIVHEASAPFNPQTPLNPPDRLNPPSLMWCLLTGTTPQWPYGDMEATAA